MIHNSFPNRHSISPFRKSSFHTVDERCNKKQQRQSLQIITTSPEQLENNSVSSPSRVRQRLSSLFRTSSPVVMTLKETFSNKRASSTVSFSTTVEQPENISPQQMEPMDDSHSTTTTLSSDSSDHMPASPADARTLFANNSSNAQHWQPSVTILSYDQETKLSTMMEEQKLSPVEEAPQFAIPRNSPSLAFQVHQILGSTLDEVDEEIDRDWEISRNVLHQSLISTGDRNPKF